MRRLILSRHGQTTQNSEHRFTGWLDAPLTAIGRREARALGRGLRDFAIDAVYSSDLQRAVLTARIALRNLPGLEPVQDQRLREANFGEWQDLTWDEAVARNPDRFSTLMRSGEEPNPLNRVLRVGFRPPGGETILEVRDRVMAFLEAASEQHKNQCVLFVASGGPLQILIASLFGLPVDSHWRLGMNNCSISLIDFVEGEPLLTVLNDCSHLASLKPRSLMNLL